MNHRGRIPLRQCLGYSIDGFLFALCRVDIHDVMKLTREFGIRHQHRNNTYAAAQGLGYFVGYPSARVVRQNGDKHVGVTESFVDSRANRGTWSNVFSSSPYFHAGCF